MPQKFLLDYEKIKYTHGKFLQEDRIGTKYLDLELKEPIHINFSSQQLEKVIDDFPNLILLYFYVKPKNEPNWLKFYRNRPEKKLIRSGDLF